MNDLAGGEARIKNVLFLKDHADIAGLETLHAPGVREVVRTDAETE